MKRAALLLFVFALGLLAQSPTTFHNYTGDQNRWGLSPGQQIAGASAACDAPYVGPGGYRTVGMSVIAGSTCSFPTIELLDAKVYASYAWPYWKIIGSATAQGALSGLYGLQALYWSECDVPFLYPTPNLNASFIFTSYEFVGPCQY